MSISVTHKPHKFNTMDQVRLINDSKPLGLVMRVKPLDDGTTEYLIYLDANTNQYFHESALELYNPEVKWGNFQDFLIRLAIEKMKKQHNDHLYSLYATRTKFEVYQYKPAIKFLDNPAQRLLIADEVGLGKTIEAGIIYLELKARLDVERVLIVCPSSLKRKWQDELSNRFDEEFQILDTPTAYRLLDKYDHNPNNTRFRAIISLEAIRRVELAERFKNVSLDLLIIDEAHHCRNTDTLSFSIASMLAENSDAALLLTATPLQIRLEDLFHLLQILNPGEFNNFSTFEMRLEPNKFINKAVQILAHGNNPRALQVLRQVEKTSSKLYFLQNPFYRELIKKLEKGHLNEEELIRVQRNLIELNTLSTIFTRTKKRDIVASPPRVANVIHVRQTSEERHFYEQVIELGRQEFSYGRTYGWAGIMQERQAASCFAAYKNKIFSKVEELTAEEESFEIGGIGSDGFDREQIDLKREIRKIRRRQYERLKSSSNFTKDSKLSMFLTAIKKVLEQEPESKILVFSYFRATVDYLVKELNRQHINSRGIHGGFPVQVRNGIIDDFSQNEDIRVLVTSDVGSEGLDFQFCNTLFNYDLPWNPMKVEQRIGRIDRFGQKSPTINIYNVVLEDTIEDRILYRLYERIEIFNEAIGDIEEILGDEIRKLTTELFAHHLTREQEASQLERTVQNILKRKSSVS